MSSFICSSNHFNSVESKLCEIWENKFFRNQETLYFETSFTKAYAYELYQIADRERAINTIKRYMNAIRELSVICVSLQYRHHHDGNLDEYITANIKELKTCKAKTKLSYIELYKAIQCILYQIETYHLTSIRALTEDEENALKFFKGLQTEVPQFLISTSKTYNECQWAI